MADSTTKTTAEAAMTVKDLLVDRVKRNTGLSLKAGAVVTIATFGVLTTLLAVNAAIGVGQGIAGGIKEVRNTPPII